MNNPNNGITTVEGLFYAYQNKMESVFTKELLSLDKRDRYSKLIATEYLDKGSFINHLVSNKDIITFEKLLPLIDFTEMSFFEFGLISNMVDNGNVDNFLSISLKHIADNKIPFNKWCGGLKYSMTMDLYLDATSLSVFNYLPQLGADILIKSDKEYSFKDCKKIIEFMIFDAYKGGLSPLIKLSERLQESVDSGAKVNNNLVALLLGVFLYKWDAAKDEMYDYKNNTKLKSLYFEKLVSRAEKVLLNGEGLILQTDNKGLRI